MPKKISSLDLGRFHHAHGVSDISCTRCGTSSWSLQSDDVDPSNILPFFRAEGEKEATGLPLLVLFCNQCANTWIMASEPISKWIEANPDAGE